MKIFIASDHAGYDLKEKLRDFLVDLGHEAEDKGPLVFDANDDYPDYIKLVAEAVARNPEGSFGIVIGGSGQGEAIVANRFSGIRAMTFYGPRTPLGDINIEGHHSDDPYEIVRLARQHNDANILSIGARFVSEEEARQAILIFMDTEFSNKERHFRRVKKIDNK